MMFLIFGSKNGVEMLLRFFCKIQWRRGRLAPRAGKGGAQRLAFGVGRRERAGCFWPTLGGYKEISRDIVYLGWPIAPLYMSPNAGMRGVSQWVKLCTWSPNKLWRSNSIFNLWFLTYTNTFKTLRKIQRFFPMKQLIIHMTFCTSSGSSWRRHKGGREYVNGTMFCTLCTLHQTDNELQAVFWQKIKNNENLWFLPCVQIPDKETGTAQKWDLLRRK
jgi:hypothetical protein